MPFVAGHTSPNKGRTVTTDPVKTLADVQKVKAVVQGDARDYALWLVATHTALRPSDLVSLRWEDLYDNELRVKERKTGKVRAIPLPEPVLDALRAWRRLCESEHIYSGQRGALTTATWGRMVKSWCEQAGLVGRFSGHSARKTFVRVHHDELGTSMATLMTILRHSSERTTLVYMGRMADDVSKAYAQSL